MNIGNLQVVWWAPVVLERSDDGGDVIVSLRLRRPHLWAEWDSLSGIFRWRVVVGWLDIRRFATEDERAEYRRRRTEDGTS